VKQGENAAARVLLARSTDGSKESRVAIPKFWSLGSTSMSAMSRGLLRAAASMALRFVDRCLCSWIRSPATSLEKRASTPPQ
jgi:hypothetical protein